MGIDIDGAMIVGAWACDLPDLLTLSKSIDKRLLTNEKEALELAIASQGVGFTCDSDDDYMHGYSGYLEAGWEAASPWFDSDSSELFIGFAVTKANFDPLDQRQIDAIAQMAKDFELITGVKAYCCGMQDVW
ncbi:MAG: hypothetical protein ACPGSN_10210 [Psychrobium sp.]